MDAFGHINNVAFVRYLEEARIDLMFRLARQAAAEAGPGGDGAAEGAGADGDGPPPFTGGSVVARHEIEYLRPLVHGHEPILVETWVTKVGGASATLAYEVRDEETLYARASTVVVPYDMERQRPRRLAPAERAFLAHYTDDQAGGAG